jgi:RND family efflux transporter MFP subunit
MGGALIGILIGVGGCERSARPADPPPPAAAPEVGVTTVTQKPLGSQLTVSSELVPFQQIDVYAKQSGYVKQLSVDYGSHVKSGQVMAVLEIPELEMQLRQDAAAVGSAQQQVAHAAHELNRVEAQQKVLHLQFERLNGVASSRPGLVAQQEVDDAQGKDLAAEAQVEATRSALEAARNQLGEAEARGEHDRVLFNYSRITAPFPGVVTRRYANLGALLQAGTTSSTQAMPLVQLSEDDRFRLVIPVPESAAGSVRLGDSVAVRVPSLDRMFTGRVARFAADVKADTRTMHTEVDVPNPDRVLLPGMYAEATLALARRREALAVPLQAVNQKGSAATVDVIGPDHRVEERAVELGLRTATDVEIVAGLRLGETIVVGDRGSLTPGEIVRPHPVTILQYLPEPGQP